MCFTNKVITRNNSSMFPLIHRISFQKPVCTLPGALGEPQAAREALGRWCGSSSKRGITARRGDARGVWERGGEDAGGSALPCERCRAWLVGTDLDQ